MSLDAPRKPRILFWDLETQHNIVAKFDLRDSWIAPSQILQERYIICGAWKELGKKAVSAVSVLDDPGRFLADPFDDAHVVKELHDALSGADLIVAHNGDGFDRKWVNGRILKHGLKPLPPIPSIDTLKVSRKVFNLNSHRLDYLGKYLGVGGKISTPQGLWIDILRGGNTTKARNAIRTMVTYNKGDCTLLEAVYLKMRPFIADHFNVAFDGAGECPRCRSINVQSRGLQKSVTQVYQRFQCQDCAGWFRLRKAEKGRAASVRTL